MTYDARYKVRKSSHCHPSCSNIGWIYLRAIDEACSIDEKPIEEDEEHDGEDSDPLTGHIWD